MSNSSFFNNIDRTLFDQLTGIAEQMGSLERFWAVVGYFRSSGYFKLREHLENVPEIRILVGINIDPIFRKHNHALEFIVNENIDKQARNIYSDDFTRDIQEAKYSPEVERGILQLCKDLKSGKLKMKIHPTRNLHAKFYLCLPKELTKCSDGWVIMGSSNLSDSGLGTTLAPRYELNVAMKKFDDVHYCEQEFERLWAEAMPLTVDDMERQIKKVYLGHQPTPYELYMKMLIDKFGAEIEDDFTMELPDGVKELQYQRDAVIQGYQMLLQHNGVFLADVVGLGKTMIATMIAKRFIAANGRRTKVLVIYPPAVEKAWKDTFKQFGIDKQTHFLSLGCLDYVLEGKHQYRTKEEYNLVIVDESHRFRHNDTGRYEQLQRICKAECQDPGLLNGIRKKVILLSATPINNSPEDLKTQLELFQDTHACTIGGIADLDAFFAPYTRRHKELFKKAKQSAAELRAENHDTKATLADITAEVDEIYDEIREKLINHVTVRRTRNNILNDPGYARDLQEQGIHFPDIAPPNSQSYELDRPTAALFHRTLDILSAADSDDEDNSVFEHLHYARYRALEYLPKEKQKKEYNSTKQLITQLASLARVHMVKRLESSFYAFKKSLKTMLEHTNHMIDMWESDCIIIAPEHQISDLFDKGMSSDEILQKIESKGGKADDHIYTRNDFDARYYEILLEDRRTLEALVDNWNKITHDPKLDAFIHLLENELFAAGNNVSGKLVVFSESVDTLRYLDKEIRKRLNRQDVLTVSTQTKTAGLEEHIRKNFDANIPEEEQLDEYNIILASDVLAEGVNLHRSHVIVNYDAPWNATRLMQRIGRVNRIGSVCDTIHSYLFYPSPQGDRSINLYAYVLIKLQGFHSAYGEDSQIWSPDEVVKQFEMFDRDVCDTEDRMLELMRLAREFHRNHPIEYQKIKQLPAKCRVMRATNAPWNVPEQFGSLSGKSLVCVFSELKQEFYLVDRHNAQAISFLDAATIAQAKSSEKALDKPFPDSHYTQVSNALDTYKKAYYEESPDERPQARSQTPTRNNNEKQANSLLRELKRKYPVLMHDINSLAEYIKEGTYDALTKELVKLKKEYERHAENMPEEAIRQRIEELTDKYKTSSNKEQRTARILSDPSIVISETFL